MSANPASGAGGAPGFFISCFISKSVKSCLLARSIIFLAVRSLYTVASYSALVLPCAANSSACSSGVNVFIFFTKATSSLSPHAFRAACISSSVSSPSSTITTSSLAFFEAPAVPSGGSGTEFILSASSFR